MSLTDDFAVPGKWAFPAGTSLCSGCRMIVWADGETAEGPLHTSFVLTNSSVIPNRVALYTAAGAPADYLGWLQQDDRCFATADSPTGPRRCARS